MPDENSNKFLDVRTWKFEWLVLVFGFLLILLGVTTGFNVPWLKQLVPDPNFRWVSISIGVVLCGLAILMVVRASTGESIIAPRSRQIPKLDFKEILHQTASGQIHKPTPKRDSDNRV